MHRNILINALGIQDSGGITVLEKMLQECLLQDHYKYYVFVYEHSNINNLINTFSEYERFNFIKMKNRGILNRLYIENFYFRKFTKEHNISLIYNFSGSNQYIRKTPSLVKVQNLMFYSVQLDKAYKRTYSKKLWLQHIWSKRVIFLSMLKRSHNFEVQSSHVKDALSDFINVEDKTFYLKNDFPAEKKNFNHPKKYNFEKKITFLYIVGPHFAYPHKNITDFIKAMSYLNTAGKDFEIKVTLSFEELNSSSFWDSSLNNKTIFLGYLKNKHEIQKLFQDNTVLISTSVIETLGLHVIEGIQNGILCIAPDEPYSQSVYGDDLLKYELFNFKSLAALIIRLYSDKQIIIQENIQKSQEYLLNSEARKFHSIIDIFDTILKKEINV